MLKTLAKMVCGAGTLLVCSTLVGAPNNAPAPSQSSDQAAEPQTYRAKQIIGSKVNLNGGAAGGTVDDIVLDENGSVEYLIVANNNRLVTVPWDATTFNFEKQLAEVKIAPEQYEKIPTYTDQRYPAFATPQYRTSVYGWYGLTPRERRLERRLSRQ